MARRACGALTARGTRREPVPGGSVAASMPPHGPASGEGTAPGSWLVTLFEERRHCSRRLTVLCWKTPHTDHSDWSLPAYHRGT
ncbi:hypothetical protein EIQ09_19270 [Xanthomonas campestris pv. campestris]